MMGVGGGGGVVGRGPEIFFDQTQEAQNFS